MTTSRVLKDYSKFKADVNNNSEEDMAEATRRRSSATIDYARRRRSSAEMLIRSHAAAATKEDDGEFLAFELEIPSRHNNKDKHANNNNLEGSLASLGDPFEGEEDNDGDFYHEDDGDTEEEDVTEERDPSSRHNQNQNLLEESYTLNNNASASSLASASSKRRTPHRRRAKPKNQMMDDQSMSQSMPDLDSRYRYNYERKKQIQSGNRSNGSLGEFLERKGRQKTNLLPGSTTEDLCSEMNLAAARALQGSSSRMGHVPKKPFPNRSTTAPELMRRNTADGINHTPSRLRDYSQPQPSPQLPSEQPYIPANPRRDSKTIPAKDNSDNDVLSPSMTARQNRRNTTVGHAAPSNRRRSKSPNRSSLSPPNRTAPRRTKSHEESSPIPEITTTKTRRLPPKSKSSDGAGTRRPVRRTHTDPHGSVPSIGTSGFITGSRIRRIQPGGSVGLSASSRDSSLSRSHMGESASRSNSPSRSRHHGLVR